MLHRQHGGSPDVAAVGHQAFYEADEEIRDEEDARPEEGAQGQALAPAAGGEAEAPPPSRQEASQGPSRPQEADRQEVSASAN